MAPKAVCSLSTSTAQKPKVPNQRCSPKTVCCASEAGAPAGEPTRTAVCARHVCAGVPHSAALLIDIAQGSLLPKQWGHGAV